MTPTDLAPFSSLFAQYGAVGLLALIFVATAYKLGTRLEKAHEKEVARIEEAYNKEVARGDRIEKELADLNKLIGTSLAAELARATDAIREALEIMRNHRRL